MSRATRSTRREPETPLIGGCGLDQGTEINGAAIDDFCTDIIFQLLGLDDTFAPPLEIFPQPMLQDSLVVLRAPDVKVS